jgi:hypothetical protein
MSRPMFALMLWMPQVCRTVPHKAAYFFFWLLFTGIQHLSWVFDFSSSSRSTTGSTERVRHVAAWCRVETRFGISRPIYAKFDFIHKQREEIHSDVTDKREK